MSNIEMIPVVSSNIESIGYDDSNQRVLVKFLNGTIYAYIGVPIHEFENLRDAPSLGSYLHRNYKNIYPYERVE
ncbi:MAG TPA: KTSC domain-containing protein [Nitrososphaera sp.]|nr:MAG: KTSC domain-containing protein [Acidobacteriota bacterium]HEU0046071.1 KTSC domain-containing protein [Nitrososphaera sp.]